MKSKRNVFVDAHIKSNICIEQCSSVSSVVCNAVLDECIVALNRIALLQQTWLTDEMCIERRCEFLAYFEILMKFFPGMDPADVLEVIKVE